MRPYLEKIHHNKRAGGVAQAVTAPAQKVGTPVLPKKNKLGNTMALVFSTETRILHLVNCQLNAGTFRNAGSLNFYLKCLIYQSVFCC
jgi:hypothetical protein